MRKFKHDDNCSCRSSADEAQPCAWDCPRCTCGKAEQPAPESEDEAFEEWWNSIRPLSEDITDGEMCRMAWNARARLSVGGK